MFFFADLDGLKQINDRLGHDVGDTASIGSTLYDPAHPESLEDVLKRADQMMYEQKVRRKALAARAAQEAANSLN